MNIYTRIPPHLDNGIPARMRKVFTCTGVPMSFYPHSISTIEINFTRFAPFFHIVDANIIALDWDFYINADDEIRDILKTILWAAGVLTTKKVSNLSIRPVVESHYNYNPRIGGIELFFAEDRKSEALVYAKKVDRGIAAQGYRDYLAIAGVMAIGARETEIPQLEVVQVMRDAECVVIADTVFA